LTAPSLGVKPSSAAAIPEAWIVMAGAVSGNWTRFSCHRSFQDKIGVMLAESGDINARHPELDFKRIHPLFIFVKLEWFQVGSDA